MVLAGHVRRRRRLELMAFGFFGIEQVYQAVLIERLGVDRRRFGDIEAQLREQGAPGRLSGLPMIS
jgi:hypothetical protein